ncbi:MAG TPA: cation:proton antiporter [Candidatus Diapherotrites archaeon]|uniref:Cation:proton antiporter n=1 Tax=Candidatus Iainarchaeum sp. TaxID=3101447 RepID=A0A7J4JJD5_9ARCH|nr:cation:proton antiporter [Candidatus Diapherotrites archaeon]HIH16960.1 cation:proton antiporter [Candidatus Diapherotrites archaeon]
MAEGVLPLTTIGIIIVLAIGLSILVRRIGLNPVLGYIFTGFLLGPFFLGFLHPEDALVVGFGELGLFILLFYLGLELSLKDFLKAGSASLGLALIDMTLSAGFGFALMQLFGYSFLFSVIVGFMLFCTSTAVVAKFAIDKGILHDPPSQLAVAILILQDFLGILLLVLVTSISASGSALELGLTALAFAVAAFYVVHHLSRAADAWLTSKGFGHTEVTLYAIGIGLIVATLGNLLHLSTALGAYFAGFALAETRAGEKIKKDVNFMRDFFLVFFFVSFGTTLFYDHLKGDIVIPAAQTMGLLVVLALVLVVLSEIAHSLAAALFGPLFGLTRFDSSTTALLLLPLGEFVVIIATAAREVLPGNETGLVSTLAFLIIAISVIAFQPAYDRIAWHRKIFGALPELFQVRQAPKTELAAHTPLSRRLLKEFGSNFLIVACLAYATVLLYYELPRLGLPLLYARQSTAILVFLLFAVLPFFKGLEALYRLLEHAFKQVHEPLSATPRD